jgi:hypothetical protein
MRIAHCFRDRVRLALILASAAAWTSLPVLTAAEDLRTTITVRVYQTAGLSSTLEQRALTEAETVLRTALVDVRWEKCAGLNPSPACDVPPGPSELLLRVVREENPGQDTILGSAVVVRGSGGVLATVYADQVARLAREAQSDVAVLLGRVAAHELGHLRMNTTAHARHGLMRANWTPCEVRRDVAADWSFTAGDRAAMLQPGPEY